MGDSQDMVPESSSGSIPSPEPARHSQEPSPESANTHRSSTNIVHLDGKFGEGGGQIVRTALGLSTLLQIPFDVHSIRHGRCTPGLKAQHMEAITALQKLCQATVIGGKVGSETLAYQPNIFIPKDIKIDVHTAGSSTLVMQALLLPVIFAKKRMNIKITGGTDVEWSMPIDYLREVIVPQLRRYAHIECNIHRRGYFPKGNGLIELDIRPKFNLTTLHQAPTINLTTEDPIIMIRGVAHASHDLQELKVAERMAQGAKAELKDSNIYIDIREEYHTTMSTGCGISLFAYRGQDGELSPKDPQVLGTDMLGAKGISAESVGERAAKKLKQEIEAQAPVDHPLADNLIPFIALCGGKIKTTQITDHTRTNVYAVEAFLGKCLLIDEENRTIERIKVPDLLIKLAEAAKQEKSETENQSELIKPIKKDLGLEY